MHGSPVVILGGGPHRAAQGRHTPPHRHACWELVCYRQGRPRYQVGTQAPTPAGPGVLWLTPPGVTHAEWADTAFANWFILIEAPADHPWPQRAVDDADGGVERLCGEIVRELRAVGEDRAAMLDLLAREDRKSVV